MKSTKSFTGKKPKPKVQSDDAREPDPIDEASVEQFLRLLAAASGPGSSESKLEVSSDVVKRVTKGALGEILAFLAEHLKGRQEVRRARELIHGAVPDSGNRGGNVSVHPGLMELEKARRRSKAMGAAVEVARKEREEQRARHESLRRSFISHETKTWN